MIQIEEARVRNEKLVLAQLDELNASELCFRKLKKGILFILCVPLCVPSLVEKYPGYLEHKKLYNITLNFV